MGIVLLAGLVLGVAVFGIVGGAVLLLTSSQGRVNMRLQQFVASDTPAPVSAVTDLRKQKRADLFAQIDARLARRGNAHELATRLERAGLSLTLSEFTLLRAGAAVLVTLVLLASATVMVAFHSILAEE